MTDAVANTLPAALQRYQIELPPEQVAGLERYIEQLWAWNEKMNLTRHTDYEKFVSRDLLDTVELAKLLHPGEEVLDVGSGGGVPGLVLSIIRPDLTVTVCDSIAKKAAALKDMVKKAKVPATVYHNRAEELFDDDHRFDAVVARAVGPLVKLCTWFEDHWASMGRLLAIKGPKWSEERLEAREKGVLNGLNLRVVATYPMPGTHSDSVILKLWPKGAPEK